MEKPSQVEVHESGDGETATYEFKVTISRYGALRLSLASVAPFDARAAVVSCYVAALAAFSYAFFARAAWATQFAFAAFALGASVERWVWKQIARRYALTAFMMSQSDKRGEP